MNSAITPPFLFPPHVRCQYVSLPVATHPGTSKNLGQYSENYMSSTPRSGVENSFIALDIVPTETRLLGATPYRKPFQKTATVEWCPHPYRDTPSCPHFHSHPQVHSCTSS